MALAMISTFYLVIKGDSAGKPEEYKISLSYTDALDRIGHTTKNRQTYEGYQGSVLSTKNICIK